MSERVKQSPPSSPQGKIKPKKKSLILRLFKLGVILTLLGAVCGGLVVGALYLYITPNLPSVASLKDVRYQVPLRIYSADHKLMAEYGEKRRIPLKYKEIPKQVIQAFLGAEDDRFFEHPGVDIQGLLRALAVMIMTGHKAQGGSTITMQVARNFFLTREKTFLRKFNEIFLSLRIEKELTKEEILDLYLNKIYLGNRAYGIGAAANVYYGKNIDDLTLAQIAMIAGLPKAPSSYNPIVNPTRAILRRNYVLRRMRDLHFIDQKTHDEAVRQPITAHLQQTVIEFEAPYAAEMARQEMTDRYGDDAYTEGYKVYTTLDSRLQTKANLAVRQGLLAYDRRHGYRGPLTHLDELDFSEPEEWDAELSKQPGVPLLEPGVVIDIDDDQGSALVYLKSGRVADLCWQGIKWAAPYTDGNRTGPRPEKVSDVLKVGDMIQLHESANGKWVLGERPQVSGALVSLDVKSGAIQSIVGGYDFYESKFNRAIQAKRQPGSNFKPFVYSAALEKGYTAATEINDAPVVFNDPGLEESWRPENYSGKFFGPTRFREALVHSRNLVSIRILRSIGVNYAISYAERFGFNREELPRNLSLALGSASVTPMEIVQGYAVFANGGYKVDSYLVDKILGPDGNVVYQANPARVCPKCKEEQNAEHILNVKSEVQTTSSMDKTDVSPSEVVNPAKRVVDARNVYIMTSILRDIIKRGTGRRARVLRRPDLAGKTGTTNDQRDAWFSGFNGDIATTVWVGFDKPKPLGDYETGARAALPIWINYMRQALKGVPETPLVQPPGIVTVRIDPATGLLVDSSYPKAMFESFRQENVPSQMAEVKPNQSSDSKGETMEAPEQLF